MSSARQYDYGKPADALSEWTSRVKSLQTLVDQDDAEERTRLEREIERARLERARRRGKSVDLTTPQSSASVSTPPSDLSTSGPISLAAFIGGKATGPRLTKKLRPDDSLDLTDYDPKPYSSKVSPLAQVARGRGGPAESAVPRGVPMPGMRPQSETSPKLSPRSNPPSEGSASANSTSASPITPSKILSSSNATNIGDRTRQLSAPRPPSALPVNRPPTPRLTEAPPPANKIPPTLSSPVYANAAAASDGSAKALTPSLTRLQSRGLVGERLKAAESAGKDRPDAAAQPPVHTILPQLDDSSRELRSVVPPPPVRKKSVLDRWPSASHSSSENFPPSSAELGSKISADIPAAKNTNLPERARAITLEPPRCLTYRMSSTPSPGRTSPVTRSFEERVSMARPTNKTSQPAAENFSLSTRAAGPSVTSTTDDPTSAQPNAPTPKLTPAAPSFPNPPPQTLAPAASGRSLPLSHPTKDRARKPKKASSAPVTVVAQVTDDDCLRPSKLSEPPQFRPKAISDSEALLPARVSNPRSQILSQPPTAPPPRSPSTIPGGDTVAILSEMWGDKAPIGVKQASSTSQGHLAPNESFKSQANSSSPFSTNKRALPGMVKRTVPPATSLEPGSAPARSLKPAGRRSPSPVSRPTAMEMAQALNLIDASPSPSDDAIARAAASAPVSISPSLPRRKSSYSTIATTLPAVAEVDTPPPSLSRTQGGIIAAQSNSSSEVSRGRPNTAIPAEPITFRHADKPSPKLDVRVLLEKAASSPPLSFDPSLKPISTDVLSIRGRIASPVTTQPHVFYDTELRAIVYRSKDVVNRLASTTIWAWRGNAAKVGDDEKWKIQDLESRFGTKVIPCAQGLEPLDLVSLLGGVIAIRQGSAAHWSAENTAMHSVRSAPHGSNVIITELDLHIQNLCSAYSYVISVMGVIYVWHGRGSRPNEASHAASYASLLSNDSTNIMEFKEGQEDPMFWACLGDEAWANADYWNERSQHEGRVSSFIWKVDFSGSPICEPLLNLNEVTISQDSIYVVDGLFEIFAIVGTEARSDRASIRLALEFAESISAHVANSRPFPPPVHVVILPSQLPLDLRVGHLQVADESRFNGGFIPGHMNVLGADEALSQLAKATWAPTELEDHTFLPLGVAPSILR